MQGVENIQTVSDALSRMLHLNLDARKFISIAEEEKYLQDYLDIQQYRYVGKLTYSISIEDSVKGCVLPKLLNTANRGNALQHGSLEGTVGRYGTDQYMEKRRNFIYWYGTADRNFHRNYCASSIIAEAHRNISACRIYRDD